MNQPVEEPEERSEQHVRYPTTLRTQLRDWVDGEFAVHALAVSLGLVPPNEAGSSLRWPGPVGDLLYQALAELVKLGIVRKSYDGQFRWNDHWRAP